MKINTSYPYPVLFMNNDDYVNSSFETAIDVRESFGEVHVDIVFHLNNPEIMKLIESGKCVYSAHIECGQTSFRKVYHTNETSMNISIPTNQLRGKIFVHTFILADQEIDNYTNSHLSDWFQGLPISFDKGNFVAIGNAIEMTLYEDNAEMLNLPSIINVTSSDKNDYMEVDVMQDLIIVSLPKYEYDQYFKHRNSRLKDTILASIFVPVLVEVFSSLDENSDFEEYTWYQVLEKIFDENDVHIEEVGTDSLPALKAAQMVLRKPFKTSFEEIENFYKGED